MEKAPLTAVVIAKNEERAILRCVDALSFCDQILVIDSHSSDRTAEIASASGATVIPFDWNGSYPKKKQWGMDHRIVRNDWVLHIDADEIVPEPLAAEITKVTTQSDPTIAGYQIALAYRFMGRTLRHGHRVRKTALVRRSMAQFPVVDDLDAPGITEVEGHYQPQLAGRLSNLTAALLHDDPDPIEDWINRHNRYSSWEAFLRESSETRQQVRRRRSSAGRLFDIVPLKPGIFFVYSYVLRLGFLDGRAGFDYAFALSWYYWLTSAKVRSSRDLGHQ